MDVEERSRIRVTANIVINSGAPRLQGVANEQREEVLYTRPATPHSGRLPWTNPRRSPIMPRSFRTPILGFGTEFIWEGRRGIDPWLKLPAGKLVGLSYGRKSQQSNRVGGMHGDATSSIDEKYRDGWTLS